MNRLLRLYPTAWRERYLAEVSDLLAERPPTLRDQLDLIRGAIDARIHPQVVAAHATDGEPIMRPVGSAALLVIGGGLWIAGGAIQAGAPYDPVSGYKESAGVMIVIAGALLTSLGAIGRVWSGPERSSGLRRATVAMLIGALLILLPWPILAIGFFAYVFATVVFGLLLAGAGRGAGILLAIGALVATSFNTESTMALAAIPFGLAWIAVGVNGAVRRSPTSAQAGA
jgi:hypothetical protein